MGEMSPPEVWVAKDDGSDIVRAAAIAAVGRDYNGNITIRLSGGEQAVVTLVGDHAQEGSHTPDDFHRQLLKIVTELSDGGRSAIVSPSHDPEHGWQWLVGQL
jgi:hypothetical protein